MENTNKLFLKEMLKLKQHSGFEKLKFIKNLKDVNFKKIKEKNFSLNKNILEIFEILEKQEKEHTLPFIKEEMQETLTDYYLSFLKFKYQNNFEDYYEKVKINKDFIFDKIIDNKELFFSNLLNENLKRSNFLIKKCNGFSFSKKDLFETFLFILNNNQEFSFNLIEEHFLNLFLNRNLNKDNIFINEINNKKLSDINELISYFKNKKLIAMEREKINNDSFIWFLEEFDIKENIVFLSIKDLKEKLKEKQDKKTINFLKNKIEFLTKIKKIDFNYKNKENFLLLCFLLNNIIDLKIPFKVNNIKYTSCLYGDIDEKLLNAFLKLLLKHLNEDVTKEKDCIIFKIGFDFVKSNVYYDIKYNNFLKNIYQVKKM